MAKSNNIKKQIDAIEKQEKSLRIIREQKKADCMHSDKNGDIDVIPKQGCDKSELRYVCRSCKKDLCLKKISSEKADEALEIVDNMCDTIKLSLESK